MKKVIIINGPNLNMLGKREIDIYGKESLRDIENKCKNLSDSLNFGLTFFQSNSESEIIEKIHTISKNYVALIINAGAFTHTSVAIHDSLKILSCPIIEVHLSNLSKREKFSQKSLISDIATGGIFGLGDDGYILAIISMQTLLNNEN